MLFRSVAGVAKSFFKRVWMLQRQEEEEGETEDEDWGAYFLKKTWSPDDQTRQRNSIHFVSGSVLPLVLIRQISTQGSLDFSLESPKPRLAFCIEELKDVSGVSRQSSFSKDMTLKELKLQLLEKSQALPRKLYRLERRVNIEPISRPVQPKSKPFIKINFGNSVNRSKPEIKTPSQISKLLALCLIKYPGRYRVPYPAC